MKKICVIGLGNMGRPIFDALEGYCEVVGCDKDDDLEEGLKDCDAFVLAVKPQIFGEVAEAINVDLSGKLAISIMAGVSIERIKEALKMESVVRVMPNLPLKVRKAMCGWICSDAVNEEQKAAVAEILQLFGEEIEVDDEAKIDEITALSGSGPAYFYFLTELLEEAAKKYGFSDEEAAKIANSTFVGAASLIGEEDAKTLRERVTSKGGTTEAAINHLRSTDFGAAFHEAIEKARQRAEELNK